MPTGSRSSARASTARIGAQQGEPWLCVLPTAHIAGLQVLLRARLLDAPVLFRPFTVEAVQAAARQRPHVSLVPTQLRRLLAAGVDLSQFRTILLGGAAADPTHPPTLAEIREWVSAHLPRYAAPRELDLRAELPLLPSGKPDVRQLSQG